MKYNDNCALLRKLISQKYHSFIVIFIVYYILKLVYSNKVPKNAEEI